MSMHLLDLGQNLIVNICRVLSVRDKLRLRMVCRGLRDLLDNPAPGEGIWGVVDMFALDIDLLVLPLYGQASARRS